MPKGQIETVEMVSTTRLTQSSELAPFPGRYGKGYEKLTQPISDSLIASFNSLSCALGKIL